MANLEPRASEAPVGSPERDQQDHNRTPHIHLKVHVGGSVVHTGQLFFDEKTTAAVYRHAPYKAHGQPDTSHAEDMIYAQAGRSRATLTLARRSNGRKGYRGVITLGVAT